MLLKFDDRLAVEVKLKRVHADGAELVGSGDGRGEIAGPANAEIVVVHVRRAARHRSQ